MTKTLQNYVFVCWKNFSSVNLSMHCQFVNKNYNAYAAQDHRKSVARLSRKFIILVRRGQYSRKQEEDDDKKNVSKHRHRTKKMKMINVNVIDQMSTK